MIYEYPKEFIVPVVYVENLIQKSNESIREWNPFSMEESLQDNGINHEDMEFTGENQDANFPYIDQEISHNDNIKSILNDIDEDYAVSETLNM